MKQIACRMFNETRWKNLLKNVRRFYFSSISSTFLSLIIKMLIS